MNVSPSIPSSLCGGPQTSTPITSSEVKLEESSLVGAGEALDVDSLDDATVAILLPFFRQLQAEYTSIYERTSSVLKKTGMMFEQLSDDAKAAVNTLVEHHKASVGGSTAATEVIHAMKVLETISKDNHHRKMREDASELSEMLAKEKLSLEATKQKVDDVMRVVEEEKLSLVRLQSETKSQAAIQKKKRLAESVEVKLEKLQMEEVTPQACVAELEKRMKLERELEELRKKIEEYHGLPPDVSEAEQVVQDAKKKLLSLKAQLKALYKL